jgi:hypothetical protein
VRRSWFVWAIVVGIASIALAALIMRLTADDEGSQSTAAWADSVCAEFATWKTSITSLADVGSGELNAEALQEKIGDAEEATSTLVSSLKDLGPPDLDSGEALKAQLSSSADGIQAGIDALKEGAEQASEANSPTAFLQELAKLAPQFQALLDSISTTIGALKGADASSDAQAELQQAFSDAESCQAIQGDG